MKYSSDVFDEMEAIEQRCELNYRTRQEKLAAARNLTRAFNEFIADIDTSDLGDGEMQEFSDRYFGIDDKLRALRIESAIRGGANGDCGQTDWDIVFESMDEARNAEVDGLLFKQSRCVAAAAVYNTVVNQGLAEELPLELFEMLHEGPPSHDISQAVEVDVLALYAEHPSVDIGEVFWSYRDHLRDSRLDSASVKLRSRKLFVYILHFEPRLAFRLLKDCAFGQPSQIKDLDLLRILPGIKDPWICFVLERLPLEMDFSEYREYSEPVKRAYCDLYIWSKKREEAPLDDIKASQSDWVWEFIQQTPRLTNKVPDQLSWKELGQRRNSS